MRPTLMTGRGDSRASGARAAGPCRSVSDEKTPEPSTVPASASQSARIAVGDIEVRPSPNGVTLSASRFPFVPAEGDAFARVGLYPWTLLQSLRVSARHVKK